MINRVVLTGRLVQDPELKTTQSGTSVMTLRLAVERQYVAKGQERKADFFDVVTWKSTAEFVFRNFGKGDMIAIDGRLQQREYTDSNGSKRYVVEVVADSVSFCGLTKRQQYEPADNYTGYDDQPQKYEDDDIVVGGAQTSDEDLPF